jgi:hypothetical protein
VLKRAIFTLLLGSTYIFAMSASEVQRADKKVLGCIKGVGAKRLNNILLYRKEHNVTKLNDLLNVSGIGKGILKNIEQDVKKKACLVNKQKPLSNQIRKGVGKKAIGAK